jgi:hypothetical protein
MPLLQEAQGGFAVHTNTGDATIPRAAEDALQRLTQSGVIFHHRDSNR